MRDEIQAFDDATLVQMLRARNVKAFRVLYLRYRTPLIRYANRYVRSVPVAEAIVQSTFVTIWTLGSDWPVRTTAAAYLFRLVRDKALRCVTETHRKGWITDANPGMRRRDRPIAGADQPSALADTRDPAMLARTLELLIAQLPEPVQTACRLGREQRMSYEQIAEVLCIGRDQARELLITAVRKLSQGLAGDRNEQ